MDLESLAKELHSELPAKGSDQNNDPYQKIITNLVLK